MNDTYFRMERELNGRPRHNVRGVASYVERVNDHVIQMWYHWTPVVTVDSETGAVELKANGYETLTTKERMNRYLNITRWSVMQHNYYWFVVSPDGDVYDFYDRIQIFPDENKVLYADRSVTISQEAKKLSKKIKAARARYAAYNQHMHAQPLRVVEPQPEMEPIHISSDYKNPDGFIKMLEDVANARQALHNRGEINESN